MPFQLGKCLLKRHLRKIKMTQVELSRRTGISEQMINHYANDRKHMNLETAKTIAAVVGVSIEELYEFTWIPLSKQE